MDVGKYHSVTVNVVSAWLTDVTFGLSTLTAPFLFYMVLRKSRK